uniref:Putative uncharacterized protein C n=1 Tax=Rabies virus (strain PM1503/AVO1) TaxID=11293 RepID=C_RABVA|nr:RecName: Full=Putative uncharacterized protein C [Rabies virus AVO1]CAA31735.1 unnamed protein product [Lyssavirus rabies]
MSRSTFLTLQEGLRRINQPRLLAESSRRRQRLLSLREKANLRKLGWWLKLPLVLQPLNGQPPMKKMIYQ